MFNAKSIVLCLPFFVPLRIWQAFALDDLTRFTVGTHDLIVGAPIGIETLHLPVSAHLLAVARFLSQVFGVRLNALLMVRVSLHARPLRVPTACRIGASVFLELYWDRPV